jgi:hypothetical protein
MRFLGKAWMRLSHVRLREGRDLARLWFLGVNQSWCRTLDLIRERAGAALCKALLTSASLQGPRSFTKAI